LDCSEPRRGYPCCGCCKPSRIQQIDIEHEGDDVVAWVYFRPADDDDCFAVSFKPPGPMPADEIRRLLTRDPMMVR
jgi:hypothetical protein